MCDSNNSEMSLDERAELAAHDPEAFERLITEYIPFINASVARVLTNENKSDENDMRSIAMSAFYEAVSAFSKEKGRFIPFASTVLHRRLLDFLRKKYRVQSRLQSLEDEKKTERASPSRTLSALSISMHEAQNHRNLMVQEIEDLKKELMNFGISMNELIKQSPKHKALQQKCRIIVEMVCENEQIVRQIFEKRRLPSKKIAEFTKMPQKTIERQRSFILASLIIRTGDYQYLSDYVRFPVSTDTRTLGERQP